MPVRLARPEDATPIAEIQIASWRTAFRGILPDSLLDVMDLEKSSLGWLDNMNRFPGSLWVYQHLTAGIRGFACCGAILNKRMEGFDGEIFGIHVSPEVKRSGFGTELMRASFLHLRSVGCRSALVWTLYDNLPARRFYEKLGGKERMKKTRFFGEAPVQEIAYGWESLELPCAKC